MSLTQVAPSAAAVFTDPKSRPIGVFDSGVGGLTVLCALKEHLPGESLVYLGDTARLPYGTKSLSTVTRYSIQAARVLVNQGIKALVVACNTASALALDDLALEFYDVPVIGVLKPGADAACLGSRNGRIAVIATESTTAHGAYEKEIRRIRPEALVVSRACSLFVALAEEGWTHGPIAQAVAHEYLDPIFDGGSAREAPDCLVLGCTRFPLMDTLQEVAGPDVLVVDSARTTAETVREELTKRHLLSDATGDGTIRLMATDSPARFARVAANLIPKDVLPDRIELIDLLMNHLAHALIAERSGGSLVGHLMGDFVKGRVEGRYEGAILEGIVLHRRIDAFTDDHDTVRRSLARFRPPYRRFAGILTDLFYDHVLAERWDEFSDRSLRDFVDGVYAELAAQRDRLPERMQRFTDYMRAADLLVSYRELEGIDRALAGISRRMRRPNPLAGAVTELERERKGLSEDFGEFFPVLLARFGLPPAPTVSDRIWSEPPRRSS